MAHKVSPINTNDLNSTGRSYYIFCLEQALVNVKQARALVSGDVVETAHELPKIERLLTEAVEVS